MLICDRMVVYKSVMDFYKPSMIITVKRSI